MLPSPDREISDTEILQEPQHENEYYYNPQYNLEGRTHWNVVLD
jgi:hypothetical protein